MKLAMMFPGQGSQSVGMLAALAATEAVVGETFGEASTVLGYDLWALCQQGPEELLAETERTQPAMLAAGIAVWRAWNGRVTNKAAPPMAAIIVPVARKARLPSFIANFPLLPMHRNACSVLFRRKNGRLNGRY